MIATFSGKMSKQCPAFKKTAFLQYMKKKINFDPRKPILKLTSKLPVKSHDQSTDCMELPSNHFIILVSQLTILNTVLMPSSANLALTRLEDLPVT